MSYVVMIGVPEPRRAQLEVFVDLAVSVLRTAGGVVDRHERGKYRRLRKRAGEDTLVWIVELSVHGEPDKDERARSLEEALRSAMKNSELQGEADVLLNDAKALPHGS